ncbi:DUF4870 domain-containing protein [Chitinophaga lutea]|uniref:DUF4870 domain-containing protein n=1 Tax=Chitinophaga lutea TaxID=2488634 RepID=A0A3N4Q4T6_9BACT|nr:DUF4870 domain-containing protein [Chitinophaga lutea]RPE12501.1 DUF4870 domain-containing protein [Chitinophaga lutea]
MTNKTMAIVAYITLIGWLIVYFKHKDMPEKSPLVSYHLGQSLGIMILGLALSIVTGVVVAVAPPLSFLMSIAGLLPLILLIFGIIAANNESCSPVPGVGRLFENRFSFLN